MTCFFLKSVSKLELRWLRPIHTKLALESVQERPTDNSCIELKINKTWKNELSINSSSARDHFHMLIRRYDKCQTHLEEHKIKNSLIKDASHVCDHILMSTADLARCQRMGFLRAMLRLFLEYDKERFETYVTSRKKFAEPFLELAASCRLSFNTREFLCLLSLVVLLKERQNYEFSCLTPALIFEAGRKILALDSVQECLEILEAIYRLVNYDTENLYFKEYLKIFSQRSINLVLQPQFSIANYASFCYFLTLQPVLEADHLELLCSHIKIRARRYFTSFDLEGYGMVLYFLILNGIRNNKPKFKEAILNCLADERTKNCSDFARATILAYVQ